MWSARPRLGLSRASNRLTCCPDGDVDAGLVGMNGTDSTSNPALFNWTRIAKEPRVFVEWMMTLGRRR
ncbi:MAG: hypothetical protein A2Z17_01175 [Gammaproteobacteria bacterium RBG_16_66_13]|nr:MAG: hypothetical protein A2Z17_01175 [Gammaproteobacteria bacterium RBG_16_66_13]